LAEGRVADDPTAAADASLAAAEAQLPHYLATDSEDSEDDEDYVPTVSVPRGAYDDEAGSSGVARDHAPPILAAQVTQPDSLAAILSRLSDQQDRFAAAQLSMQAEQARQREAQTLVLEGICQQQEAMRIQLQQQSQIQQQIFTFFLGCFGQLYRHTGLPEPQLPTPHQLQFDPTAPPPPAGGFVQTPLASFPMSPLL